MFNRILDIVENFFTTILNLLYGGFGALINNGVPEARRILRGFEWLAVVLIISGAYALMHQDVPILSGVLLAILLLYYAGVFASSFKIRIGKHEIGGWAGAQRTLSLLFMFFTPIVILLLFDINFATSKIGVGMMAGYFIVGIFFDAFGRFTGRITNAAAYWLTLFMFTTLILVGWKSAFPNNYTAHKVEWERKVNAWTAHKDRKSFPNGLDAAATYTKTTEEVFCFYKSQYTFSPARPDTITNKHLKLTAETEVAVVNHGTAPEMWGDEQMVLVRLKDPVTNLFTGKKVWVPSRFLDNFQSPLDYKPKPRPIITKNSDSTTIATSPPRDKRKNDSYLVNLQLGENKISYIIPKVGENFQVIPYDSLTWQIGAGRIVKLDSAGVNGCVWITVNRFQEPVCLTSLVAQQVQIRRFK